MANSILSAPHFQNEEAAFAYVEAKLWPEGPVCPHCGSFGDKIGKLNGKTSRVGLYKCYQAGCRKPFTVRIGTIFESSHLPLHLWLQIIHLMCASKKGLATRQIQRMLRCSMKTAWFLGHRIREAMSDGGALMPPMGSEGGYVEADETYVGGKAANRKDGKVSPKKVVVALVNRDGEARAFHLRNTVNAATLWPILATHVSFEANLMTDTGAWYKPLSDNFASHQTVNHSQEEYARGIVSTNRVEGYFAILKRGVTGVYHSMSEKHLKR
jgi:transposase-like protein